jgi:CubicO group peptidase (beta-lactamase class C family)
MIERIRALIDGVTQRGVLPGVVAGVATDEGVVHLSAHGVREHGSTIPIATDSVLWIASMTKAVTAVAAMQLVERGALDLDAPAGALLPYLGSVQVCDGFDAEGRPRLRPPRSPVTLRALLTHTAGFVYPIWNADLARYQATMPAPAPAAERDTSLEMPLMFDPGQRWEYGIGIDWAGRLVETVTGQRLGVYLAQHVFAPLGMTATRFGSSPALGERQAAMHMRTPDGLTPVPDIMPSDAPFDGGGGGLYSTVPDYLQFLQMILHRGSFNGARILAPETIALMSSNHIGALDVAPLRSANAMLSNDCNFFPGMAQKWGLSFLINTQPTAEGRAAGSLSWAGLANSYFWIDPVQRVAGVLATQVLPFFDADSVGLFRQFERAAYTALR